MVALCADSKCSSVIPRWEEKRMGRIGVKSKIFGGSCTLFGDGRWMASARVGEKAIGVGMTEVCLGL